MHADKGGNGNCIFCRIVRGELDSRIIYEDATSLAILDISPLTEGHCLVIPKRHVQWFYDLSDSEVCHLFQAAKKVSRTLERKLKPDVVCMIIRGMRIPHVHIILIPSSKKDIVGKLFAIFDAAQGFPPSTESELTEKLASLQATAMSFSNENLKRSLNVTEKKVRRR